MGVWVQDRSLDHAQIVSELNTGFERNLTWHNNQISKLSISLPKSLPSIPFCSGSTLTNYQRLLGSTDPAFPLDGGPRWSTGNPSDSGPWSALWSTPSVHSCYACDTLSQRVYYKKTGGTHVATIITSQLQLCTVDLGFIILPSWPSFTECFHLYIAFF